MLEPGQHVMGGGFDGAADTTAPSVTSLPAVAAKAGMLNPSQTNHYYAFGGMMDISTGQDVQRLKYNGKELDRMNGLDYTMEIRTIINSIILATLLFSCGQNKGGNEVEEESSVLPAHQQFKYEGKQYFIKDHNGNIYITQGFYTRIMYKKQYAYKYKKYEQFLYDLLRGKIKSDFTYYEEGHKLYLYDRADKIDSDVWNDYKSLTFLSFKKKYLKLHEDGIWTFRPNQCISIVTVAYCMWLNGYFFDDGCFSGMSFSKIRIKQ